MTRETADCEAKSRLVSGSLWVIKHQWWTVHPKGTGVTMAALSMNIHCGLLPFLVMNF